MRFRHSMLATLLAVATSSLACVPASEPLPPAGAAGAKTEPSPAARHQPFVTSDGWTIVIEKTVLRARVSCRSSTSYSSSDDTWIWYGDASLEVYSPGLALGTCAVNLTLSPSYFYEGKLSEGDVQSRVSEEDALPFERALMSAVNGYSAAGPSVLLRGRAERGARVVTLDFVLASQGLSSFGADGTGAIVEVRADALVTAPVFVRPEAIFTRSEGDPRAGQITFDEIANADSDGDGLVTTEELRMAPGVCTRCPANYVSGAEDVSLLGELGVRAGAVLDDDPP